MSLRVLHSGDVHYCPKHLEEVDRCFGYAVTESIRQECQVAIIAGDLFDHKLDANAPSLLAALTQVQRLANAMPTLLLAGTLSHDAPNALQVFRYMDSRYPLAIMDRIGQAALHGDGTWSVSDGWAFETRPDNALAVVSCLPAVVKGAVAAAVGAEQAARAAGDLVADILAGWRPIHEQARAHGVPAIVAGHGTVNGSITEHGQPMVSLDHELSSGALFASEASACMLAHIHRHQSWEQGERRIAYCSSPGRLHFGEHDPKGFLIWDIEPAGGAFTFCETPAKRLVEIEFTGAPNMDELRAQAANLDGAHVRIRYAIDEEHRHCVDREAIEALFAGAAHVRTEARILPVQRQRAAGITQSHSLADKLRRWCEFTETAPDPLVERLAALQTHGADGVIEEHTR